MTIEWNGGSKEIELSRADVEDNDDSFEDDELPVTEITLEDATTDYLTFTILDAVEGTKYDDVAISEIKVYANVAE